MKQTICSVGDAILLERFPKTYDIKPIKEIKNGNIGVNLDD